MAEVAADTPQEISDQEIVERFRKSDKHASATRTLGFSMRLVSQHARSVEVDFDARANLLANPMGQIQGGMVCAMLDEAMSISVLVTSKLTCFAPTLEMKTSFLRPAMPGKLRAVGRVIRFGKTIAFTEGELFDAEGNLLAKASATVAPTPIARFRKSKEGE